MYEQMGGENPSGRSGYDCFQNWKSDVPNMELSDHFDQEQSGSHRCKATCLLRFRTGYFQKN